MTLVPLPASFAFSLSATRNSFSGSIAVVVWSPVVLLWTPISATSAAAVAISSAVGTAVAPEWVCYQCGVTWC